jgi:dienelactone hydrolase
MSTVTRDIAYDADDTHMIGYYAVDPARQNKRPGILVSPSGPGLGDHAKSVARRLADVGYAAFAVDYHGGGKLLQGSEAMPRIRAHVENPLHIRARLHKALEVLRAQPQVEDTSIGAIGYCFGGTSVLELARSGASVTATVGFHSGLKTARPQDAANIRGKVLVCLGADDPLIPLPERAAFEEEMRKGGVDWQMYVYGGAQHGFTDPESEARGKASGMNGLKYDEQADRRSWRSMLDLFADVWGPAT